MGQIRYIIAQGLTAFLLYYGLSKMRMKSHIHLDGRHQMQLCILLLENYGVPRVTYSKIIVPKGHLFGTLFSLSVVIIR